MPLTHNQKKRLLTIARATIESFLIKHELYQLAEEDPQLKAKGGAFVSLHKHGRLRGCVGDILGLDPLYIVIRNMALAAAIRDSRFLPLAPEELKDIDIEISVLSKPIPIRGLNEIELGRHGVIAERDDKTRGVFLPQVALETKWNKEEFLSHLCMDKAGLPADAWKNPEITIKIFETDCFSEKDFHASS